MQVTGNEVFRRTWWSNLQDYKLIRIRKKLTEYEKKLKTALEKVKTKMMKEYKEKNQRFSLTVLDMKIKTQK